MCSKLFFVLVLINYDMISSFRAWLVQFVNIMKFLLTLKALTMSIFVRER